MHRSAKLVTIPRKGWVTASARVAPSGIGQPGFDQLVVELAAADARGSFDGVHNDVALVDHPEQRHGVLKDGPDVRGGFVPEALADCKLDKLCAAVDPHPPAVGASQPVFVLSEYVNGPGRHHVVERGGQYADKLLRLGRRHRRAGRFAVGGHNAPFVYLPG